MMSQPVQGLIDSANASTPQKEMATLSRGTDQSGLIQSDSGFNQGLAYKPQSDAIRQKYLGKYEQDRGALKNKMDIDSRNATFNKLAVATEAASKEAQMNFEKKLAEYKRKMAKRAARSATIGSVLGLVGTVV